MDDFGVWTSHVSFFFLSLSSSLLGEVLTVTHQIRLYGYDLVCSMEDEDDLEPSVDFFTSYHIHTALLLCPSDAVSIHTNSAHGKI